MGHSTDDPFVKPAVSPRRRVSGRSELRFGMVSGRQEKPGRRALASAPGAALTEARVRNGRSGMGGEKERWFGPGETARRLGVTTKALRVYEREGLVVPHRAESRWRLGTRRAGLTQPHENRLRSVASALRSSAWVVTFAGATTGERKTPSVSMVYAIWCARRAVAFVAISLAYRDPLPH